jgi:hypothetical protein
VSLGQLFNGQDHELEPDGLFEGATMVVDSTEEEEEDEPLDPYEEPSQVVMLRETASPFLVISPDMEFSQGWGMLSGCLGALAEIVGGTKRQYQHNHYGPQGRDYSHSTFTFQYVPDEDGWTGERL